MKKEAKKAFCDTYCFVTFLDEKKIFLKQAFYCLVVSNCFYRINLLLHILLSYNK